MTPPNDNAEMPGPANINLPNDPSPNILAPTKEAEDEAMENNDNGNLT